MEDDEIWYDMDGLNNLDFYPNLLKKVFTVLKKIPEEVYDYIMKNIVIFGYNHKDKGEFINIEYWNGIHIKGLIKLKSSETEFTIAHEIAHAFLKHENNQNIKEKDNEKEADDLAIKWGFSE
jgi:Zn-dependent peptidase ImmA (M78 family)